MIGPDSDGAFSRIGGSDEFGFFVDRRRVREAFLAASTGSVVSFCTNLSPLASTSRGSRPAARSSASTNYIKSNDDSAGSGLVRDVLASGWWHHVQALTATRGAYGLATGHAVDPNSVQYGPNVFNLPRGVVFGIPSSSLAWVYFANPSESKQSLILGGYRRVGDRRAKDPTTIVAGGAVDEVVTTAGHEGDAWASGGRYSSEIPPGSDGARPPDCIIDSGYAYQCTTGGQADTVPPDFDSTVGHTTTDNEVVWTCVGTPCVWSDVGALEIPLRGRGGPLALSLSSITPPNLSDYTLDATEQGTPILVFSGSPGTGTMNVTGPTAAGALYYVRNGMGAANATVKTSGGTGPTIGAGKSAIVFCDGTDYARLTADA